MYTIEYPRAGKREVDIRDDVFRARLYISSKLNSYRSKHQREMRSVGSSRLKIHLSA